MLRRLLANYPKNSDLFRWLDDLVQMWDGDVNYCVFWFTGFGMPRREYKTRLSQRGQQKVDEMVRRAIRCHKRGELVDLGKMDEDLREAIDLSKSRPHHSRFNVYEAVPFIKFFKELLKSVEIYGLELTGAGEQALARVEKAYEENWFLTGSLCQVDELLEELDQLVDGRLLGDGDAAKEGNQASVSEWLEFYPVVVPLTITLHLDTYVQPAHSKEEWAKCKDYISDEELGYQQVEPSDTAFEEERQCPWPSEVGRTPSPAAMTDHSDHSDQWSYWAYCGAQRLQSKSTKDLQCLARPWTSRFCSASISRSLATKWKFRNR